MTQRPDQGAEATSSEQNDATSQTPDSKGPIVMLAVFVALLGAVIVLGMLTQP